MANKEERKLGGLVVTGLALSILLAGCVGSSEGGHGSALEAPPGTESPVVGTVPPTESTTSTTATAPRDDNGGVSGLVGKGPEDPVPFEYTGFAEENWTIALGQVSRQQTGVDVNSSDTQVMVLVELSLTYLGDNGSGQLLDLVFELDTPAGRVDAVRSPCSPQPVGTVDLFASVPTAGSVEGVLCFDTDQIPSALVITPLIDEPFSIPFEAP